MKNTFTEPVKAHPNRPTRFFNKGNCQARFVVKVSGGTSVGVDPPPGGFIEVVKGPEQDFELDVITPDAPYDGPVVVEDEV